MKRTEKFVARFEPQDKALLGKLADKRGVSMADILIDALREYGKKQGVSVRRYGGKWV